MASSSENPKPANTISPRQLRVLLPALLLIIVLGSMIGSGLVFMLGAIGNIDVGELLSNNNAPITNSRLGWLRGMVAINHFFSFLVPGLIFSWLFWRSRSCNFLKLDQSPRQRTNMLAILWLFSAFPVSYVLFWLNQQIPLPDWMSSMELQAKGMLEQLLFIESPMDLIISLSIMALLPALGEELIFRGLLQNILQRSWRRPVAAILVSAAVFSAIHMQFEGFLPRFFLGAVLGYLFYWTRNLWVPIIAHFFYNGIQVVTIYAQGADADLLSTERIEQAPGWWVLPAILVFFILTRIVYKHTYYAQPV